MSKAMFNRNYVLILATASLFYISSFMLNSTRGRYCTDNGHGGVTGGVVICVFTLSSFFSRSVWAYITDKSGRRKVLYTGVVLCFLASVGLVFYNSLAALLFSRFVFGIGYSAVTTSAGTIVCDVTAHGLLPQAISFYGVTNVLSQALAPSFALWLYNKNFLWVCIVVSLLLAAAGGTAFFIRYKEKDYTDNSKKFAIAEKTALPAAYTVFFFATAMSPVYSYVPVMAKERNIASPGMFFAFSALSLLAARLFNTKISRKFSVIKTFYAGTVMFFAGFIILGFSNNIFFLCTAAVFYGFGSGLVHPVTNTAAVKDCSKENKGLATATFMMSQDLGMTAGALTRGVVSGASGFTAVYILSAVLAVGMGITFKHFLENRLIKK